MNDKKLVNLAIDFGTTNTLVAYFEDTPKLLSLPGISYRLGEIDLVPSIIGYSKGKSSLSRIWDKKQRSYLREIQSGE